MKQSLQDKLKKIEQDVESRLPLDRYRATYEQIVHSELAIKFLGTQAGKDLQGEAHAQKEVLQNEQILRVKKAELSFLSNIICKQ